MEKNKISLAVKYMFCIAWTALIAYQWISIKHNAAGVEGGIIELSNIFRIWEFGKDFFTNLACNSLFALKFTFYAGALYGLGRFLLSVFNFRGNALETFIFSNAAGYAALGGIFFIVAALKLLYAPIAIILLAFFLLLGIISAKKNKARLIPLKTIACQFKSLPLFYQTLSLLIFLSTLLSFSSVFTPDTGFDAMNYYLPMSRWLIISHGIADMPSHTYFNLFGLFACVYAPAIAIGGELMAKAVNFYAVLPGTLGLAFYFGKKYFGMKTTIMALSVICLTYQFNGLAFTTRSDSMMIMFSLASLAAALKIPRGNKSSENAKSQRLSLTVLAGIFAGAAMAVKSTSILTVIPVMAIMFYRASYANGKVQKDLAKKAFTELLLFTAVASALVIPWLVKNYIYRGNPFFPFLTGIFGLPENYDAGLLSFFYMFSNFYKNEMIFPIQNLFHLFFMPEYIENDYMSPLILILIGFTVYSRTSFRKRHLFIAVFASLSLLFQIFFISTVRYYLATYVVCVLFAAYYAGKCVENNKIFKTVFISMLLLAWLPSFQFTGYSILKGLITQEQFLRNDIRAGFYEAAEYVNNNLPENSYIIDDDYLGCSSYLHKPFYVTSILDKYWHEIFFSPDNTPKDMLRILREKGFTHIISNVKKDPVYFATEEITEYRNKTMNNELNANVAIFKKKYLREIFRTKEDRLGISTSIYEITDIPEDNGHI